MFLWVYQLRKEIQIRNKKTFPTFEEYFSKIEKFIKENNESQNFTNL